MAIKISGSTIIDDSRNIVSGAAATFTGNVTIGGTLTYEDVTNIDSIGIITARQDIHIGESIVHIGDTDTKIRFPNNNQINLETNGNSRITVGSGGNVTFSNELRIPDSIAHVGDNDTQIRFPADDTVSFETAGSERLRITSVGRVGIGTDIPATLLHLFGSSGTEKLIRLDSTAHKRNNFIGITGSDNLVLGADEDNEGSGSTIRFRIDGSEKVRITSGGRVAIGTDSGGNDDTDDIVVSGSGKRGITVCSTDGSECRLTFADGLSGVNAVAGNITYDHSVDRMDFYTNTTRRVSITNTGRVGIGLTNPQRQLHIVGNDGATGATTGNSDTAFIIDNQGTNGAIMEFLSENNGNGYILFTDTDASNRGAIRYKHSDDSMKFHTAATERMSISSTGYVSGNINVPCWYGSQDTQHNVPTGTYSKIINLGNDVVNPSMNNGGWDESSGRFTVQAGQAGTYFIYGGVGIDDIQANDYVQSRFYKNGSGVNPMHMVRNAAGTNQIVDVQNHMMINLAEGDYVEYYVYHNEGTTESTEASRTFFGGYRLAV